MPFFQPMPLGRKPAAFDHSEWIYELKYDGFRALAVVEYGTCTLFSRNGNPFASFSELVVYEIFVTSEISAWWDRNSDLAKVEKVASVAAYQDLALTPIGELSKEKITRVVSEASIQGLTASGGSALIKRCSRLDSLVKWPANGSPGPAIER
jgi:hypothetical protein